MLWCLNVDDVMFTEPMTKILFQVTSAHADYITALDRIHGPINIQRELFVTSLDYDVETK